jgi:DNA-binding winged helix-turn-helix (wHTH) protein/TolB-like protein
VNEPFGGSDQELDARARRIDLAHEPDFTLGPIQVQPSLRTITGPDGEVMLEPKVMQVLVALGTPQGAILSRDDLIERCWEGRVVGDTSINRVISLLRAGFKSVAGDAAKVENVPKVGYRLLIALEAAPKNPTESETGPVEPQPQSSDSDVRKPLWLGGALLALIALVAAFFALQPSDDQSLQPIRVAMLPISVAEGVDPLYARGLESELRAQLARVGKMEVTNSDTARQLFEEGLSPLDICERLGADYAWVGALSVEADRVSLRARLIESATKETTFREEFTSAPDAAQYLPLRTARAVSTALGRPVPGREPQSNVTASDYSLYLTALGLIKSRGREQSVAARNILEQVTEGSPDFADGWAGLSKAIYLAPADEPGAMMENRERGLELAQFALSLDPDAVDALKVVGMMGQDSEARLAALNRAVELDPGDSEAWFWLGITRREFLLAGEDPLEGAARMAQIDPLWPASWRASDLAAEFGQLDRAREIENTILSAAVTPSQRLLAEARTARMDGDLSRFLDLSAQAAPDLNAAERRFGSSLQTRMARILLDLPIPDADIQPKDAPFDLVARLTRGDLPSIAEMEVQGVDAQGFWHSSNLLMPSLPLYLREGREAELLSLYDEAFGDHAAFLAFAREQENADQMISELSPYLALILREAGREAEAEQHLAEAEAQLAQWRAAETGWVKVEIWDLQLAAITGDAPRAVAAVERLPDYGWPYTMGHIDTLSIGLVRGNPIYDAVRDLPEVRAVLGPIEAVLARERAEVLGDG